MRTISLQCRDAFNFIALILLTCALPLWAAKAIVVPSAEAASITAAMAKAQSGDTIWVEEGVYAENVCCNAGVTLASRKLFKAVIDGRGRGTAVNLANGNNLSGFEIRNGTIGVYSGSRENAIVQCRIVHNIQAGVVCVGPLPLIEDAIIAYNRGSGIKGWDVQSSKSSISHSTIAYNENHGISLGGVSYVVIENCIVALNGQAAIDGVAGEVKVVINNNDLVSQIPLAFAVPSTNTSADPLFKNPLKLDFTLKDTSPCKAAAADRQNMGIRILY